MKAALQSPPTRGSARLLKCLGASILLGMLVTAITAAPASATPPTYTGLVPARLLDTRPGSTTVDGMFVGGGQVGAGSVVSVPVLGRGGVPLSGVGAVALNVTVAASTANSFLTVFPAGASLPTASNLNFAAGQTIANMVIVPVAADGKISVFNSAGQTHLIVDVLGWFADGAGYVGAASSRLLDTRPGSATVDGMFVGAGQVGAGSVVSVPVLGRGGVPLSGVGAVALNVTAAAPTANSFLTVFPAGATLPTASNLNFAAGQTIANTVIVPVGPDGRVSLYNSTGQTHLIVDVLGWFEDEAAYAGFSPARLLDTRVGGGTVDGQFAGGGQVGPESVLSVPVLGRGGVPASGVGAVAVNVTAVQPCASSFLTVFPAGLSVPTASSLNFGAGQTIANTVIVPVGSDGKVSLYNSTGQADLLVDVLGWFAGNPISGGSPVTVTSSGGCGPTGAPASPVSQECTSLTNAHRAAAGVAPVTVSLTLNAAAQGHSDYQAAIKTMTHDGPYGNSPGTRMSNAGYSWRTWGENVAYGYIDCSAVITAWMNSPGHRANMLNPAYTNIGIAVAVGSNGYKYWTMDLAAPR
ncbi:MAG: CAP domain-containing protein [Actinomycetia bacterium]|nr:CAP domain-containing protein [Actinomycetes bacterium]